MFIIIIFWSPSGVGAEFFVIYISNGRGYKRVYSWGLVGATVCRLSRPDCRDSGGGGVDVWGVEAGYGEERAEGKL